MEISSLPGLTSYANAHVLQLQLVERRILNEIPDTVLLLEHAPVVTRGRGLQFTGKPRMRHMPLEKLPSGIEFFESERGGDLTYHGPGQLVIYPVCKVDDVTAFIRFWEQVVIGVLGHWGIKGQVHEKATGVWVGDKKLASIGIAVKRWVTYHGIALNCVNDLSPFQLFSPCGFDPEVMGRMMDYAPGLNGAGWRDSVEEAIKSVLFQSLSPKPVIAETAQKLQ